MGIKGALGSRLKNSAAAAALMMFAQATPAHAQEQAYPFDIPAQDLGSALKAFARASHQQVTFSSGTVRGKRAPQLSGSYSARAALAILLRGTGLEAQSGRSGVFIIWPAATSVVSQSEGSARGSNSREGDGIGSATDSSQADIVVTGTNIRGLRETAAPTEVVTRRDLDRSGTFTTEQFARNLPQNLSEFSSTGSAVAITGNASPTAQANTELTPSIDLRGLGAGSTLVLLDGQRRPLGLNGRLADISSIPLSVIERVEVVTGGRSAIYGSDAVGGVVNFVTRRSFDGEETQVTYRAGNSGGGDRFQASQTFGTKSERGGFVIAYDFQREQSFDLAKTNVPLTDVGTTISRQDVSPELWQHSGYLSGEYKITDGIKIYGQALASRKVIDSNNADNFTLFNHYRQKFTTASFNGGADLSLGQWNLDLSGNYDFIVTDTKEQFQYVGGASPTLSTGHYRTPTWSLQAIGNGTVLDIAGRELRAAFGTQYREEAVNAEIDRSRSVTALFGELNIDLAPSGGAPWLESLSLSAAGRYDHYSDFGETFNPQFGIIWKPTGELTLRGTYSTAFRAPDLVYSVNVPSAAYLILTPSAASSTAKTVILDYGARSPNLGPEKGKTFTGGLDYKPEWASWLKIGVDYYNIQLNNRLVSTSLGGDAVVGLLTNPETRAAYAPVVNFSPSAAEIASILSNVTKFNNYTGRPFNPATQDLLATFGSVVTFNSSVLNIARENISGLDFHADAELPLARATITAGLRASYVINHTTQLAASSPRIDQLNAPGKPVDLRLVGTAGFELGSFGAFLTGRYAAGYEDRAGAPVINVGSWTTYDLTLQLKGSAISGSLAPFVATLAVTNLFANKPPVYRDRFESGLGYDPVNADPFGRMISVSIRAKY